MLLVNSNIVPMLSYFLAAFNLVLVLPLTYLHHEFVLESCIRGRLLDLASHVVAQVSLLVLHLLTVHIHNGKLIFLQVARASDSHGGEGDLFILVNTDLLSSKRLFHSLMLLSVGNSDSMLERSNVELCVQFLDTIKSLFLYL